jgi:hypothetical protein
VYNKERVKNRFMEKKNFDSKVYRGRSVMRLFLTGAQRGSY